MKTRTKVLLGIGAVLLSPVIGFIVLAIAGWGYLVWDIYTHSEDLRLVDNPAYIFCQNIVKDSKFVQGPVYFRVDRGSTTVNMWENIHPEGALAVTPISVWPYNRTIILTKKALQDAYLDVIVAHELGHIQHAVGERRFASLIEREQEADVFAAGVVGSKRVLEFRLPQNNFTDKSDKRKKEITKEVNYHGQLSPFFLPT